MISVDELVKVKEHFTKAYWYIDYHEFRRLMKQPDGEYAQQKFMKFQELYSLFLQFDCETLCTILNAKS